MSKLRWTTRTWRQFLSVCKYHFLVASMPEFGEYHINNLQYCEGEYG